MVVSSGRLLSPDKTKSRFCSLRAFKYKTRPKAEVASNSYESFVSVAPDNLPPMETKRKSSRVSFKLSSRTRLQLKTVSLMTMIEAKATRLMINIVTFTAVDYWHSSVVSNLQKKKEKCTDGLWISRNSSLETEIKETMLSILVVGQCTIHTDKSPNTRQMVQNMQLRLDQPIRPWPQTQQRQLREVTGSSDPYYNPLMHYRSQENIWGITRLQMRNKPQMQSFR